MSVVSFTAARRIVEEHARTLAPPPAETVPLLEARARVLAEPIVADRDFPPFARAIRDGYAVRAADLTKLPARLEIAGEIKAGVAPELISCGLHAGEAAEIMTGAPLPPGADAVVMVEYTERHGDIVEIKRGVAAGENFVPRGAEARAGDRLLAPGMRLEHAAIAVAASVGKSRLQVYGKPRVAVLSTGDEIVDVGAQPGPNQIRNSNSYSLAAQVAAAGAEPVILPVAKDDHDELRRLIQQGLQADLLLLTGGVSMGKYDLVEQVLVELDAEFFFTGALIQPGRPIVFGRVPNVSEGHGFSRAEQPQEEGALAPAVRHFFGLPGNPVSTMVTFNLFARVIIDALAGAAPRPLIFLEARLKSDFTTKTGLTRFLPAILTGEFERCEVEPVHWHGSGDIAASARANCYLVVPPDRERLSAGELVSVLMKN